mgnify:FL=1
MKRSALWNFVRKDDRFPYLLLIPIYYIGFWLEESLIQSNYRVSYLPLDDKIPFLEGFIIPYILWLPFLCACGLYLFCRDRDGYKKFMTLFAVSFYTTLLLYALFPNGQDLRPEAFPRDNLLTRFIANVVYKADTNTNVCPSLHVIGAMNVCYAVFHCKSLRKPRIRVLTVCSAILISISTVFVKQHSILDIFLAIPFSLLCYLLCYPLDLPAKLVRRIKAARAARKAPPAL